MSLTCLNNIVTIRGCSEANPLSGLDLMDAPEVTPLNLSASATEKDTSGLQLAQRILTLSSTLVRNDLMNVLSANRMLVDVTNTKFNTSDFKPATQFAVDNLEKGLTLIRANRHGWKNSLKKMTIHTVKVYPLQSYTGATLKIYDSGNPIATTSTYSVNLVANQINEFDLDYEVLGEQAHVVLAGVMILGSSYLNTCAGCSGSLPNQCGYTKSYYNGQSLNGREGYGLGVEFSCECDYDRVLCNLAKTSVGNLIWLRARMGLMEERIQSNRLSTLVVFGIDQAKETYNKLSGEYSEAWSSFVKSLPAMLKQWNGDCIQCNGIRSIISE